MQHTLQRCGICGWGTFEFTPFCQFTDINGAHYEVCPKCTRALFKRRGKYALSSQVAKPTAKVKKVKKGRYNVFS